MKNYIPLILAVVLGLAAVFAVGQILKKRNLAEDIKVTVIAAHRDIAVDTVITSDMIMEKKVPGAVCPVQAISWHDRAIVIGQKALRSVKEADYLLFSDVGASRTMADIVGVGEWAVSLHVSAKGIAEIVQSGNEVAIIGTFQLEKEVKSADMAQASEVVQQEATLVLFPKVRVLEVLDSSDKNSSGGAKTLILALPPSEAQVLVAAQRQGELTLALRRPGDETALNRLDAEMINHDTFNNLLKGLKVFEMPQTPGYIKTKIK